MTFGGGGEESDSYSRKERTWKVPLKFRPGLVDSRGGGGVIFSFSPGVG